MTTTAPSGTASADLSVDAAFCRLLCGSFARIVGGLLVPASLPEAQAAAWLYREAPFCLLAHDTGDDPKFIYGNMAVQRCFEYGWEELTRLPSRLSAEQPDRAERQRLLEMVLRQGYISDYQGIRVARSGRRFRIEGATVWELRDADGLRHGQAAMFRSWRDL
ncbi:MEKHLA domain-containing protein [Labrys monachus]|uniref:MEKHLA domain-containing protein n=1 Tax=Labrys monachus TaxID=217067 RepID=A0ABU0FFS0_9HYPH|nr:MEKHLA domain-containing protein [Labrys monachus]MDQ0392984.1 hypothetical protein [Labrys monachus]